MPVNSPGPTDLRGTLAVGGIVELVDGKALWRRGLIGRGALGATGPFSASFVDFVTSFLAMLPWRDIGCVLFEPGAVG